jgi:Fe-S cluster biogenesis protein NfuA
MRRLNLTRYIAISTWSAGIMIKEVQEVIENQVRPALQSDGGDIELVDVEDGIVKVKLVGACAHCPSSAMTLYQGVEKMLMELIPEVKGIEQVF